jgi:hypothetical protein
MSNNDFSRFVRGMVAVIKNARQRIVEHGSGFIEAHPVLPQIGRCFVAIPFELNCHLTGPPEESA